MTTNTITRWRSNWAAESLSAYWPNLESHHLLALPFPSIPSPAQEPLPPMLRLVDLPGWGNASGVNGQLLVPDQFLLPGDSAEWSRVDWWSVVDWYLNGRAERAFEREHGPIHSYSFRLNNWDQRHWQHAWVNRIAMFLREWIAHQHQQPVVSYCGPMPEAEIIVTHDIDAIKKTSAIRLKQMAQFGIRSVKKLLKRHPLEAFSMIGQGMWFGLRNADYWCFDEIRELEEAAGLRSQLNIYSAKKSFRSPKEWLMDPAYSLSNDRLRECLQRFHRDGWTIGLHQSFDAWNDAEQMISQRIALESAIEAPVSSCRQHWLRFGWEQTWHAQEAAGFELDTTLGFNDRPGFRNGSALLFRPAINSTCEEHRLAAMPMVLMDSHLYDYHEHTDAQRQEQIDAILDEVRFVGGRATVIWHQRVLSADYGWRDGFEYLTHQLAVPQMQSKAA